MESSLNINKIFRRLMQKNKNESKIVKLDSPSGVVTVPALLIFVFHIAGVVGAGLRSGVGG